MKIGIDIDGVLAKTFEKWVEIFSRPDRPIKLSEFVQYDKGFGKVSEEELREFYTKKYLEVRSEYDVYEGAYTILSLLQQHDIVFITNRVTQHSICPATLHWLKKHNICCGEIIHTPDKALTSKEQGIAILIEDAPDNAFSVAEENIPVLLFNRPYNQDVQHPNITRFTHWIEVPKLLRRIL